MRLTTKNYSQQIPLLIEKAASGNATADITILEELRAGTGEASRWPTDDEFLRSLTTNDAYGWIARRRLLMAMEAIEASMFAYGADVLNIADDLTIEHVMPQSWKRHWPLATGLSSPARQKAVESRESRINKLGNLTLTVGALNTKLSNAAWSKKQLALNKNSKLLLNTHLIDDHPVTFDEAAIDRRTHDLAKRLSRIWPGPESEWI